MFTKYVPVVALSFAFAAPSLAADINMKFESLLGRTVSYDYSGVRGGGISGSTTAGRFEWSVNSSSGDYNGNTFSAGDTVHTFCVELTQFIGRGRSYDYDFENPRNMPTTGQLGAPMGDFRAGLLSELFANHFNEVTNDATKAAAFQIAVWEIVYQDGNVPEGELDQRSEITLDVKVGAFTITASNSVRNLANAWLAELIGGIVGPGFIGFTSGTSQDQVTMVPIPAPIGLAALGLAGVVIGRRRLSRLVDK